MYLPLSANINRILGTVDLREFTYIIGWFDRTVYQIQCLNVISYGESNFGNAPTCRPVSYDKPIDMSLNIALINIIKGVKLRDLDAQLTGPLYWAIVSLAVCDVATSC